MYSPQLIFNLSLTWLFISTIKWIQFCKVKFMINLGNFEYEQVSEQKQALKSVYPFFFTHEIRGIFFSLNFFLLNKFFLLSIFISHFIIYPHKTSNLSDRAIIQNFPIQRPLPMTNYSELLTLLWFIDCCNIQLHR